ncbi:MAG: AraC family transcriptional regulator [Anaerolineae bacterium]|nr:AraC family transcriptional regulator [Anaerolineae bacterium]
MDALKHVLHAIRLQPQLFRRHELTAPWRIQLSALNIAAYHLVEDGGCWFQIPATGDLLRVERGDLIVISNTRHYEITDQPSSQTPNGGRTSTTLISGEFRAEHNVVTPIFSLLPALIHIQNQDGQPIFWLATALQGVASEVNGGRPGYEAVVSRLMDILFIMVMRSWIDQHSEGGGGWLGALYDPHIGKTLNAIHGQPEQPWTLDSLAQVAGLSRSFFSERFTVAVGESPMKYLTRWRVQLATTWLGDDDHLTVEQIAHRLGYSSAFAFSKAFKRLTGSAPTAYRKQ